MQLEFALNHYVQVVFVGVSATERPNLDSETVQYYNCFGHCRSTLFLFV